MFGLHETNDIPLSHKKTLPHTDQPATFLQQKDFLSPGHEWLSYFKPILHCSSTKGLGHHLGVWCNETWPGGLCFNNHLFSFLWNRFMTGGRERDNDPRAEETLLGTHRAGTSGVVLLTSLCSSTGEGIISSWFQVHPILSTFLWETRLPQAVALSLAEHSAKSQWLTPHVGDFSAADRYYFSLSPLTQAGETAHFRQDALPKVWCNPTKKNLFTIQNQNLVSANSEGQRPEAKAL